VSGTVTAPLQEEYKGVTRTKVSGTVTAPLQAEKKGVRYRYCALTGGVQRCQVPLLRPYRRSTKVSGTVTAPLQEEYKGVRYRY
jgi:hypothetical protein